MRSGQLLEGILFYLIALSVDDDSHLQTPESELYGITTTRHRQEY